jgi:hypothetical protein
LENEDAKMKASNGNPRDKVKSATDKYEQQMQQLFATLQEERKLHHEKLNEMNA